MMRHGFEVSGWGAESALWGPGKTEIHGWGFAGLRTVSSTAPSTVYSTSSEYLRKVR